MNSVTVVGAGAWGTALALQAHRAGSAVALWARTPLADRRSPHLPGHRLPEGIALLDRIPAGPAIVAVPTQHLRAILGRLSEGPFLLCCKGVEHGTGLLPLEVLATLHPDTPGAVLTGPNFAHEVAAGLPAASVVASSHAALRADFTALLGSASFRLYGNDDPVGAQLGGATKNVMAIAAGAVIGAGLGENARAAVLTRGLAELGRLVGAQGGRAETVSGLSGLGDVLLTCTGAASRNYRCGLALGRGETLAAILAATDGVIEGVATAPALLRRAGAVDMPVVAAVVALLEGTTTLAGAIAALMTRPMRDE